MLVTQFHAGYKCPHFSVLANVYNKMNVTESHPHTTVSTYLHRLLHQSIPFTLVFSLLTVSVLADGTHFTISVHHVYTSAVVQHLQNQPNPSQQGFLWYPYLLLYSVFKLYSNFSKTIINYMHYQPLYFYRPIFHSVLLGSVLTPYHSQWLAFFSFLTLFGVLRAHVCFSEFPDTSALFPSSS